MQYMVASHTSCRGPGCSIWWPLTQVVGVQDAVYGGPLTQVVGVQDAVHGGLSHKL